MFDMFGSRLVFPFVLACASAPLAAVAGAGVAHAAPPPAAVSARDAKLERALDAWAKPFVDAGHLSGNLLVVKHGKIVAERSWGFAQRELGVQVTPETRFCVASITKPMTAAIAVQLLDEQKLALGDTLGKFVPGFPSGDSITVEMLMQHRSGIPHRVTKRVDEVHPMSAADVAERATHVPLLFAPGSSSAYSSGGYAVLARVLEVASGTPFSTLLETRVFAPCGMTHSTDAGQRPIVPMRAAAYVPGRGGLENAPLEDFSYLVGAGSVWSTARDLDLLMRGVVSGALGASVRASLVRAGGRLSWNGSTNGFRAWADYDSASGLETIYTGNVHAGAAELLQAAVKKLVAGETPAPAAIPVVTRASLTDAQLESCEAAYLLGNGQRLAVRAKDGALWANDWVLEPIGPDRFFSPRDYGDVRVVRDAAGRPERLDWAVGGSVYPAPKVGEIANEPDLEK